MILLIDKKSNWISFEKLYKVLTKKKLLIKEKELKHKGQ